MICPSNVFEVMLVPAGPAKCLYITYSHLAGPAGTSRKLSKFPRVSACALVPRWSLLRLLVPSSSGVMVSFKNLGGPGFSSDEMHTICSIDVLTVKFFFPTTDKFRGAYFYDRTSINYRFFMLLKVGNANALLEPSRNSAEKFHSASRNSPPNDTS